MSAVLEALRRHADAQPNAVAMIGDDAVLTYAVLAECVAEVAAALFPKPGMRCGLLLDNGIGWHWSTSPRAGPAWCWCRSRSSSARRRLPMS